MVGVEKNTLVEEVIAFVAAGFAAAVTRAALPLLTPGLAYGVTSDPLEIRFVTGVVFFAVLITLGRRAFRNDVMGASGGKASAERKARQVREDVHAKGLAQDHG
jgi:hypothetical protein